ncbi:MAG: TldD/PmbA family protein [Clostridia bacterium]|nr:TldD/PmbA family protein [Clostridia bacterium]
MMELFAEKLLSKALAMGCEAAEVCIDERESFRVKILQQEVDEYSVNWKTGIGLRVLADGKNGYAYSEIAGDAEELIRHAMDNAAAVSTEDVQPMQTAQQYAQIQKQECPLCALSEAEKIELAKQMERETKLTDSRVFQVPYCIVTTHRFTRTIRNTAGLDARDETQEGVAAVQAAVRDGGEVHDGFAYREGKQALDVRGCAQEAVQKAVSRIGARSYPSGKTAVLLENEAASDLLQAFVSAFCADQAQRRLSPFTGKTGSMIASEVVTIVDDPFYERHPHRFDGEGTPAKKTVVVDRGRFRTFLHNLKTAKKEQTETTANASRPTAGSPIGVGPTNLYILPGQADTFELMEKIGSGILIDSVTGLHAGLNPVTGDFSLLAGGYVIEDGKRGRAVEQVTVAGNLRNLLMQIRMVGNDLKFAMNPVGSPSLWIEELTVAGDNEEEKDL